MDRDTMGKESPQPRVNAVEIELRRRFTHPGEDVYDSTEWELRKVHRDGRVTDLRVATCRCREARTDSPFAVLASLRDGPTGGDS